MMLVAIFASSWALTATLIAIVEGRFRQRWRALAIEAIAQCERGTEALTRTNEVMALALRMKLAIGDATPDPIDECQVPPEGWKCSRAPGHEGPCAARRST